MKILVTVPEGATALDVLATRYRIAFAKTQIGREQWIEGTLELAAIILESRELLPDHREFSRWITRNQLEHLSPNELTALIGMGEMARKDPTAIRKLLEENILFSWRTIWERKANRPKRTPITRDKGPISHTSGASKRKRRNRIPTAMQDNDDDDQPSRPSQPQLKLERKGVVTNGLTREQVDPDFKGTSNEFATKYGHVTLHTKREIEQHKQQEKLSVLLGAMAEHERTARAVVAALADIDTDTLRAWQQKPGKAEKWQTWCKGIVLACEQLKRIQIETTSFPMENLI